MRSPKDPKLQFKAIPFQKCLAKTTLSPEGNTVPGSTVVEHCLAAGLIARKLAARYRPKLRERLFPDGCELIASLHDIGKLSPGFQAKIFGACNIDAKIGVGADFDKLAGCHSAVGAASLADAGPYIAEIVGRHHGDSPPFVGTEGAEIYGGEAWRVEREHFRRFMTREIQASLPVVSSDAMADAISGLVTVADWISSGDSNVGTGLLDEGWAQAALNDAGFFLPSIRTGLDFRDIFDFSPNAVQVSVGEMVTEGCVQVVEAPMGLGKTEAALYASYKLLERGEANGLYFALPTRATSDRMLERMDRFLDAILEPGTVNRSARLLHGQAWLRATAMGEEGAPGGAWFEGSKRGILAPFCVGTIDQALLAVMNVRFGFVRSFGLAGKVVVLDEVHSYDCYTGTLLDALVRTLRQLGSTVIILSATLSQRRRRDLIDGDRAHTPSRMDADVNPVDEAYPLVTVRYPSGEGISRPVMAAERGEVSIRMLPSVEDAITEALDRALSGQQVLWIENTVSEAQATFEVLAARASAFGLPAGLLHARFTAIDRESKELEWVTLYGKAGIPKRKETGRILVGTQVLEQSLDIDADFLVSRLAPTDLLLQRIGRLWRHRENDLLRRDIGASREAWVISPGIGALESDRRSVGNSAFVYPPYVLCRTLETMSKLERVDLPGDIRRLIEETYAERTERPALAAYLHELSMEKEKLGRLARGGIGTGGKTISDAGAPTRYAERESRDLLLLKSLRRRKGELVLVTQAGESLELKGPVPGARDRRSPAALLCGSIVSIPSHMAPKTPRAAILQLSPYLYLGREDESIVAVGIVGEGGLVTTVLGEEISVGKRTSYEINFGYRSVIR